MREDYTSEDRRKRDWSPLLIVCATNIVAIALAYGKLDQRVAALEQLRIEARAEVTQQIADVKHQLERVDANVSRLLERR